MLKIIIPGKPIPQKRPRFRRMGNFVSTYDPSSTEKNGLKLLVQSQTNKQIAPPIKMELFAYMPIPKSFSKKKKAELLGSYHVKKPDLDNIEKFYMDLMSGICYHDDAEICVKSAVKIYSEDPRVVIHLSTLDADVQP